MKQAEEKRFQQLYQRHLRLLKLQGKSQKTIEVYSRASRRARDNFDCWPEIILQAYYKDFGLNPKHLKSVCRYFLPSAISLYQGDPALLQIQYTQRLVHHKSEESCNFFSSPVFEVDSLQKSQQFLFLLWRRQSK